MSKEIVERENAWLRGKLEHLHGFLIAQSLSVETLSRARLDELPDQISDISFFLREEANRLEFDGFSSTP